MILFIFYDLSDGGNLDNQSILRFSDNTNEAVLYILYIYITVEYLSWHSVVALFYLKLYILSVTAATHATTFLWIAE